MAVEQNIKVPGSLIALTLRLLQAVVQHLAALSQE